MSEDEIKNENKNKNKKNNKQKNADDLDKSNKKIRLDPAKVAANKQYDQEDEEDAKELELADLNNLSNEQLAAEFSRRGLDINGSNFTSDPEEGEDSESESIDLSKNRNKSAASVTVDTMQVETIKGSNISYETVVTLEDVTTYKKSIGQTGFDPRNFVDISAWRRVTVWCLSAAEMNVKNPLTLAELKAAPDNEFFSYLKRLCQAFQGSEEITSVIDRVRNLKLKVFQLDTGAVFKLQDLLYNIEPHFDTVYMGKEKRKELIEIWKVISTKFFKHVLNHRVDNYMQQWIVLNKDDEAIQMPDFIATLNMQMREINRGVKMLDHLGVKMLDHLGAKKFSKFSKFWKTTPSPIFSTWSRMPWLWGFRTSKG